MKVDLVVQEIIFINKVACEKKTSKYAVFAALFVMASRLVTVIVGNYNVTMDKDSNCMESYDSVVLTVMILKR